MREEDAENDENWIRWSNYVRLELKRQNEEIKATQKLSREQTKEIAKLETKVELNNVKITFLVLIASTVMSLIIGLTKEYILRG